MKPVQVGDIAPDFALTTQTGQPIHLRDFRNQKVVVLFFYPMDGGAICTKEACAFRDSYEEFCEAGAVVIGVSSDSSERHGAFADKHNLPFYLGSDVGNSLRQLFGVPKTLGIFPGRTTYVIDKRGVVRLVFNAQLTAEGHVREALKMVAELKGSA